MPDSVNGAIAGEKPRRLAALFETMDITDVPRARPNFARQNQATGLTLLSLALTLDHVTRVTESLRLINTDHLGRVVSFDIDLRDLTAQQRRTLEVHERADLADSRSSTPSSPGKRLWVPISRHSREDLAPVVVRDAIGSVVPRLTQTAVTSAVIAGVTWLFRTHLKAEHTAHDRSNQSRGNGSAVPKATYWEDQRARWLIEAAIARLIEHGTHGGLGGPPISQFSTTTERDLAKHYLEHLSEHRAKHLEDLLMAATREYFLTVMLPAEQSHHFLTYQAPLIPAVRSTTARRRAWRAILPVSTEFTVSYVTQLPRAVGTYHVTIEVPEEIDVRRFILSTDADQPAVEDLKSRIDALLSVRAGASSAVVKTEEDEIRSSLDVLSQRRRLDIQHFDYYLQNRELLKSATNRVASGLVSFVRRLAGRFGVRSELGRREFQLRMENLGELSHKLTDEDLGSDVSTDNDPRENGAHAQWRPVPLGFGHPTVEPVEAKVYLAMADEPPALVESVARMLAALLVVVVGLDLIALRLDQAKRFSQADAVVAVLLIVPGILLSRLDIPATRSILGRLRKFPQGVAFLSVAITTCLAMVVAVESEDRSSAFNWCAALLAILLLLCFAEIFARSRRRKVLVPASDAIPPWLRHQFRRSRKLGLRRTHPPDVYFDAIRPVPNTTKVASRQYEENAAKRRRHSDDNVISATEGPALLAEVGARAVAGDYVRTWVEVAHANNVLPDPPAREMEDFLFTSFHGIVLQASWGYVETGADSLELPTDAGRCASRPTEYEANSLRRWMTTSPFESVAIRPHVDDVDILVEFPEGPLETPPRSLTFLHRALAEMPSDSSVVPILVLAPAAATIFDSEQGFVAFSKALGSTLRITFTMPHGDHKNRLALELAMVRLAEDEDVKLYRASRRPGAGHGDWERLYSEPSQKIPADPSGRPPPLTLVADVSLIPVTFVAPPGSDTVGSFKLLTAALRDSAAKVVSLTASSFGQYAVVQILVSAGTATRTRGIEWLQTPRSIAETFDYLSEVGVLAGSPKAEDIERIEFDAYIGYAGSGLFDTENTIFDRRALWIDWELPAQTVQNRDLALLVLDKCRVHLGETDILHWRSGRVLRDKIRGRAKLAVATPDSISPGELGKGAKSVQSELIAALRHGTERLPGHSIFVHAVWLEPWVARRRGV
jgi:hypothetical protein